jgi:hypothetical protein
MPLSSLATLSIVALTFGRKWDAEAATDARILGGMKRFFHIGGDMSQVSERT